MKKGLNLVKGELIGSAVKIVKAKNRSLEGLEGRIIDETQHTFVILQNKKRRTVLKDQIMIAYFPEHRLKVEGRLLKGKPEDRMKQKVKTK
ncbi:ribonuclease P protein subunit [Candidatus Woesearchaeota archaeon]|nr:ribonuclease P protein subunit [Candidatus Woesearchaeota archaeon]